MNASLHLNCRKVRQGSLLILCALLPPPIAAAFEPGKSLPLGVFPRRAPADTRRMFTPLAMHLGALLGIPVHLDTPPDFPSNDDSNITTATDLKGKTVILGGGRAAMMASIVPQYLLSQAGLQRGDYLIRSTLHPVSAVLGLIYRQGDAAGAGEVVPKLPSVRARIGNLRLREPLRSRPLAHLPWAVSKDTDARDIKAITQALLSLNNTHSGRFILDQAGLSGLSAASDEDYTVHRAIVVDVLGERY